MSDTPAKKNRPVQATTKKIVPAARGKPVAKASLKKEPIASAAQHEPQSRPRSMADEVVATKLLRDTVLLEKVYLGSRLNILLTIALIVALLACIGLALRKPDIKYFATSSTGAIMPLNALDDPVMSVNQVLTWSTNAITKAYTFSFANYRQELQSSRDLFTTEGWEGFQTALQESGNLKAVVDSKFVTTAAPRGAPVVVGEGYISGRYAWKIEVPILVTYQSANKRQTQDLLVQAIIVRRSELEHPQGIGIAQIIAQ
jgi:intracellular multiplication protein IcmL